MPLKNIYTMNRLGSFITIETAESSMNQAKQAHEYH